MKIYTGKGDAGQTSLIGGKRVSKASARVCAYGDMDELISHIGLLRCSIPDMDGFLRKVQMDLMTASAHVATEEDNDRLTPFAEDSERFLEEKIDEFTSAMPQLRSFVLPAYPESAARCHVARCVCRRAERSCVALEDGREVIHRVLRYLNRLSDFLFTLGRRECYQHNMSEDFWT